MSDVAVPRPSGELDLGDMDGLDPVGAPGLGTLGAAVMLWRCAALAGGMAACGSQMVEIQEWASEHRMDARISVCPMMEASPCDGLR
jgi:hypothetical protein